MTAAAAGTTGGGAGAGAGADAAGGAPLSCIFCKASRALICAGVSLARTARVVAQAAAQATKNLEICIPAFYVKVNTDATR